MKMLVLEKKINPAVIAATTIAFLVAVALRVVWTKNLIPRLSSRSTNGRKQNVSDSMYDIEPLRYFNWERTEPIKYRGYKPLFHMTMALERSTFSEIIQIDNTYLPRIQLRKQLMDRYPSTVLGATDELWLAIAEYYRWLLGVYLPKRFPTMFSASEKKGTFSNLVTGDIFPLEPPESKSRGIEALKIMSSVVDTDFMFLFPSDGDPSYRVKAWANCFPGGFDPVNVFDKVMSDVHMKVPDFNDKLLTSVDRYLTRIDVSSPVRRVNWNIVPKPDLFDPHWKAAPRHLNTTSTATEIQEIKVADPDQIFVRSERQTLQRLPKSKAVVFSVKTYMYPLRQIKEEGYGPQLADAIDGLRKGSSPKLHFYKNVPRWGAASQRYLRGEE